MKRNLLYAIIAVISVSAIVGVVSVAPAGNAMTANVLDTFFDQLRQPIFQHTDEKGGESALSRPVVAYEEAVTQAVESASPSVVSVVATKEVPTIKQCPYQPFPDAPFTFYRPCQDGTELQEVGGGTGFVISEDGLIVTNKHVVIDGEADYSVLTNDGRELSATVIARDPVLDFAVLRVDGAGLPSLRLGDSSEVVLGQTAIAIGNALGEFENTVSVGVISGVSRNIVAQSARGGAERIEGVMQTDAAINPGNSGGPLLNLQGEVVGINTAVARGAQNIGFAIPINQVKKHITSIRETGSFEVPYLGVRYVSITPAIAAQQNVPMEYGAWIRSSEGAPAVVPGGPADEAGLKEGDVIVRINNFVVGQDGSLATLLRRFSPGEEVSVTVLRDEKEATYLVALGSFPN